MGTSALQRNGLACMWRRRNSEGIYLPEAGINGADKDSEGLSGAAPHGAEDFAEKGDEPQPALNVPLLQLLPHGEILLQEGQRQQAASAKPHRHGRGNGCLERELGGNWNSGWGEEDRQTDSLVTAGRLLNARGVAGISTQQSHQKAGTVEISPTPAITVTARARDGVPRALPSPSDRHGGLFSISQPRSNKSSDKEVRWKTGETQWMLVAMAGLVVQVDLPRLFIPVSSADPASGWWSPNGLAAPWGLTKSQQRLAPCPTRRRWGQPRLGIKRSPCSRADDCHDQGLSEWRDSWSNISRKHAGRQLPPHQSSSWGLKKQGFTRRQGMERDACLLGACGKEQGATQQSK